MKFCKKCRVCGRVRIYKNEKRGKKKLIIFFLGGKIGGGCKGHVEG
jgi:hypothetical protein